MTVNTTTSSTTQIGNGATTVWNYSFYIPDATDVVVKITQLSTGNVTTLSLSQYTITGLGDDAGGTVTYSPALGTGYSITIARVLPLVQATDLSNQGALYPVVIEDALDYLTMICQQMTATYNRAVTAPDNDVVTSLVLPVKALRAEKLMGFDVNGSPTYYPVGASTSASIINFTQAGTGAVTRSVQSKMQDVLSVKDFGATGDGTTDDTTAVQACITAAALANRAVYIPGGAYKLSAQLVYSGRTVSIYGDGPEITELFWTAAAGSTGILITLAKIASFSVNFNIRGLSLTTLKTVSGTAIRVVGTTTYDDRVSTRAIVKDLVIRGRTNPTTDGWLIGLELDATPRCYVENVNFIGKVNGAEPNYSSTYGIRYGNFSSATTQPTEVMMHACIVNYAQNAMYFSDMEGALLTSCQIIGVNNGVTFTAAVARPHGSVIGCHINASAAAVLVTAMYEVILSSNLFYLQNATADGIGVQISGSAGYFTINNNVFENYNNSWACNSIIVSSGTKGTIASNIFRRTNSIDTTRNGVAIWLTAGSSYCTVSNDNTFGVVATTVLDSGSSNVNLFTSDATNVLFTQSGTGASTRNVTTKLREVQISIKDFGALGDGSTDDTTAIRNAYAELMAQGGGILFAPRTASYYRITDTINFNTANKPFIFRGEGPTASRFRLEAASPRTMFYFGTAVYQDALKLIEDLSIIAPTTACQGAGYRAMYFYKQGKPIVRHCSIDGGQNQVFFEITFAPALQNVVFSNSRSEAVYFVNDKSANGALIHNCSLFSNGLTNSAPAIYMPNGDGALIIGNDIEGNHSGIFFGGTTALSIIGNYIETSTNVNLYCLSAAYSTTIQGNWLGASTAVSLDNMIGGSFTNNSVYNFSVSFGSATQDLDVGNNYVSGTGSVGAVLFKAPGAYTNSWAAGSDAPGYMKKSNGLVVLRGELNSGTLGATAFTLPVGYRPAQNMYFITRGGGNVAGFVIITTAGAVQPQNLPGGTIRLDGITFNV